jgi:hypothetical protein
MTRHRSTPALIRAEHRIVAADGSGIIERWRWGRIVLADPRLTCAAGTLRRRMGIAAALVQAAHAKGLHLDEREIQYRLACARAYRDEATLSRMVRAGYTWTALRDAGFPGHPGRDEEGDQLTLVDVDTGAAGTVRAIQPPLDDGAIVAVFPALLPDGGRRRIPLGEATLGQLSDYVREMRALTERHARRDMTRATQLGALLAAVGGDLTATVQEAVARSQAAALARASQPLAIERPRAAG